MTEKLECSFCGATEEDAEKLITAPENKAVICDDCVFTCLEYMVYGDKVSMQFELENDDEDSNCEG